MFIVCGEALMDVFTGSSESSGLAMRARIGGSPLNVAIGLARLGQPVTFLGAVSKGMLGDALVQAMLTEGISIDCVERNELPTTLSLVGVDPNGVPEYAFYGAACADRELTESALDSLPGTTRAIHFGSYAMLVGRTATTLRSLVERRHRSCLISYDPNVRLNVEPDVSAWRATLEWMLPRTDLLKVSDEDLELLYPGSDTETLATSWLDRGPRLIIVTRGAKGAVAWTKHHRVNMAPVPAKVIDTVGAGDSFSAAMLLRYCDLGLDQVESADPLSLSAVQEVLRFASRAASVTCSRQGADLPRIHDLE